MGELIRTALGADNGWDASAFDQAIDLKEQLYRNLLYILIGAAIR